MDEDLASEEREAFESQAPDFYTGSGRDKKETKGRFKGFFKKRGPVLLITGLLGGIGALMMGAQTLMPMAIEEMIIEKFNSIGISSTVASDAWLDTQLNQGIRLENIESGNTANLFAFSEYQVRSFEKQGIKVLNATNSNNGIGGTRVTRVMALLYEKDNNWIPVVGGDILKYDGYTETDLVNAIKYVSGLENIGKPVSADTALADPDFKVPYTTAAKGWRGGASGWFDKIMKDVTETKLSINRNRWSRYTAGSINDMMEEFLKTATSAVKGRTSDFAASGTMRIPKEEFYDELGQPKWAEGNTYVYNAQGSPGGDIADDGVVLTVTGVTPEMDEDGNITAFVVSGNNNDTVTNGVTKSTISKVLSSKAIKAANVATTAGCALVEGIMSIYTVVSAYQSLQFLNLISGYLEAVDRVKVGDGANSPIHIYSNNLTTPATTISVKEDGTATESSMGGVEPEEMPPKTGMESQGMKWLFGSKDKISSTDPSVQNVNLETMMSNLSTITSDVRLTAKTFEGCGYVKLATSAVDLASTVLSFIPIIGGGIKVVNFSSKLVSKALIKGALTAFFYATIPVVAQKVANSLIADAATEWFGEDLGNAIVAGAGKYLGGNGTSGGQSPGSKDKVLGYLHERDEVIAEEAEYQRAIRSPFDASSQHTFLGSLIYSMMPLAYSNSSVASIIKGASELASSSFVAMMPTANAIDENSLINSTGDCILLESVGVVGDAFCNAYIITDMSTMATSPKIVDDKVHAMGDNFEPDGSIKKGSNLAKYITYCGQRTSQYGVKDAKIAELSTGSGADFQSFINYVPVLGELASISAGLKEAANMAWTTGEACVASETNSMWGENQWYQRYAENERLLENINPGYTSTVAAFMRDHYKENPVDDSFEGQIARFSGMDKEKVVDTLALIEYYNFLANYDPGERYAFGGGVTIKDDKAILFTDENEEKFYNVWWYNNIYDRVGRVKTRAEKAEYTIC